jgi:DNA-binding NarL/FixJ family response regulator
MVDNIRVVLADDHPIVRDGIRNLLTRSNDITVIGEASDGYEAIRLADELEPDVLLLDMEMPGLGGAEVARTLREVNSPVKILVLSAYNDRQYILELLGLGAAGYLIKDEAPMKIVEAVRGVADGQRGWLSERVAERVYSWKTVENGRNQNARRLNQRELEVLQLSNEGKTRKEISAILGLSIATIEKHEKSLMAKLGVDTLDAAIQQVSSGGRVAHTIN